MGFMLDWVKSWAEEREVKEMTLRVLILNSVIHDGGGHLYLENFFLKGPHKVLRFRQHWNMVRSIFYIDHFGNSIRLTLKGKRLERRRLYCEIFAEMEWRPNINQASGKRPSDQKGKSVGFAFRWTLFHCAPQLCYLELW